MFVIANVLVYCILLASPLIIVSTGSPEIYGNYVLVSALLLIPVYIFVNPLVDFTNTSLSSGRYMFCVANILVFLIFLVSNPIFIFLNVIDSRITIWFFLFLLLGPLSEAFLRFKNLHAYYAIFQVIILFPSLLFIVLKKDPPSDVLFYQNILKNCVSVGIAYFFVSRNFLKLRCPFRGFLTRCWVCILALRKRGNYFLSRTKFSLMSYTNVRGEVLLLSIFFDEAGLGIFLALKNILSLGNTIGISSINSHGSARFRAARFNFDFNEYRIGLMHLLGAGTLILTSVWCIAVELEFLNWIGFSFVRSLPDVTIFCIFCSVFLAGSQSVILSKYVFRLKFDIISKFVFCLLISNLLCWLVAISTENIHFYLFSWVLGFITFAGFLYKLDDRIILLRFCVLGLVLLGLVWAQYFIDFGKSVQILGMALFTFGAAIFWLGLVRKQIFGLFG